MQTQEISTTGNLYRATVLELDDTHKLVSMFNTWDHDGGTFPLEDLDTMISTLTALRDKTAP